MSNSENVRVLGRRSFVLRALIFRAPDVDDQWIAHCPNIDVISQGNTPAHAVHMIMEATTLCIADDLLEGFEPEEVRKPDTEVAVKCDHILKHGNPMKDIGECVQHQDRDFLIAIEWVASIGVEAVTPDLTPGIADEVMRARKAPRLELAA